MLQRPLPLHDENRPVSLSRPAHDEENAVPGVHKASGKAGKAAGGGSTRKALGNITNASKAGENRQAGKGLGRAPRKALGDITNATPRGLQPAPKAEKETSTAKQAHTQAEQDDLQSQAEAYAEDGIERLAGNGWRELEKQQQLRADADIAARVAAINAVPFCIPFMAQAIRRQQALHDLPGQPHPKEFPPPPSPPPTPYCSLDLDDLCPAEALLLDIPTVDWTFGGMFPDRTTTSRSTSHSDAVDGDGASGID